MLKEMVPDPRGGPGKLIKGWRSNHLGNEERRGPLPWCTAQGKQSHTEREEDAPPPSHVDGW